MNIYSGDGSPRLGKRTNFHGHDTNPIQLFSVFYGVIDEWQPAGIADGWRGWPSKSKVIFAGR
ncbi:hypothetical protein RMSM_00902 [Rhodopirellula maiorica SM1]|uniref:Uncharacterized protein n=1 Tax=Rhodopirellula maiorica SM1 TaxID=1265738 RepID=M5S7L4_9BACT|nr:hypothetical protein RMSM_00902 [Rhodopirellula maiorica SM1]